MIKQEREKQEALKRILQNQLNELEERANDLRDSMHVYEVDPDEHVQDYEDMLHDVHGLVEIGSLTYDPARVLREVDPVAYRCGLSDYIDSIDKEEQPDYIEMKEELEDIEADIETVREQIEDIEQELED